MYCSILATVLFAFLAGSTFAITPECAAEVRADYVAGFPAEQQPIVQATLNQMASFGLPAPLHIPAASLPFPGNTLPTNLSGIEVLIVGGTSGIGNATAWEYHNRGASVTITGRDAINADPVPFRVMELDYTNMQMTDKFVAKYIKKVGRTPHIAHLIGAQFYWGNLMDFDSEHLRNAMDMYVTGPLTICRDLIQNSGPATPINITFALSTTANGAATSTMGPYAGGKMILRDHIRDFALEDGPKKYPWVTLRGVQCAYVKTDFVPKGYNPSILDGDSFSIDMDTKLAAYTITNGNTPQQVALAHLEAATTWVNGENLFLVPTSVSGRVISEILYSVYASDSTPKFRHDSIIFYQMMGVNIPNHICCQP